MDELVEEGGGEEGVDDVRGLDGDAEGVDEGEEAWSVSGEVGQANEVGECVDEGGLVVEEGGEEPVDGLFGVVLVEVGGEGEEGGGEAREGGGGGQGGRFVEEAGDAVHEHVGGKAAVGCGAAGDV